MSSNPIYSQNCYTYLIGWSKNNMWYYGSRYARGATPTDLWITYFTSSVYVEKYRKEFGEPDVVQVRNTFGNDSARCRAREYKLISRLGLHKLDNWLNRHPGGAGWYTSGTMYAKNSATEEIVGMVDVADPRVTSGEWVAYSTGSIAAKCAKTGKKMGLIKRDDQRWATGEIVSYAERGVSPAKIRSTGENIGRVSVDDPRWETGEIVGNAHGAKRSEETKLKKSILQKKTVVAKDAKTGNSAGRVSVDDPRWKTGEIVGYHTGHNHTEQFKNEQSARHKGKAAAQIKTTKEQLGKVSLDDPRWETGEIEGIGKGRKLPWSDSMKSYNSLYKPAATREGVLLGPILRTDTRWMSGEIVHPNATKRRASETATGKYIGNISIGDPRWITGEIQPSMKPKGL